MAPRKKAVERRGERIVKHEGENNLSPFLEISTSEQRIQRRTAQNHLQGKSQSKYNYETGGILRLSAVPTE